AELLVQGNRPGVVRVDGELDAREVEPSIGQANHFAQQPAAHAATSPRVVDAHPDLANVAAARAAGGDNERRAADDLLLPAGHQHAPVLLPVQASLSPGLPGREGNL